MDIKNIKGSVFEQKTDAVVLFIQEGRLNSSKSVLQADKLLQGRVGKHSLVVDFTGKPGQVLLIQGDSNNAKLFVVSGLGDEKTFAKDANKKLEAYRSATGSAFQKLSGMKIKSVCVDVPSVSSDVSQAIAEAVELASYQYNSYKSKPKKSALESVVFANGNEKGIASGQLRAKAAILARDLVNTPAQHMRPVDLANSALDIAKKDKRVKVTVLNRDEIKKKGMRAFLAIAQGSHAEPKFLHLVYKPAKSSGKKIVLVGKGLTFDSGGLSLKDAKNMYTMKMDMAGAAAVLGVFSVISQLNVKAEVHGIIAACENMPGGNAIRPGDVVSSMSGKTIEILHTDAEGRVTLADSLFYGSKLKPSMMIDLATLTGACVVALGEEIAGLMSNDKRVSEKIKKASDASGELIWELPLFDGYKHELKSKFADMKNDTSPWAGSVSAGLFLKEFVGNTPWAHIDIAGPAYAERAYSSYTPIGGTGFGVRMLLNLLENE
ncbi:MAG: hypothetical protein ACD_76C00021G0004 [uncultured bacterium]|nr:MAG: hypothetical protein ACD_76C00021G0004 [uncultured bacterium]HBD05051.1 leucyl aminopeptidase [Candidatus Uhrbacteria bacterium]